MKTQDLLEYALGQLEDSSLEIAESAISSDPDLAAKSTRLKASLDALLDDGLDFEPPAGLALRASRAVEELASQPATIKMRRRYSDFLPQTFPFRWADVAVAASIFMAGVLSLPPAIQRSRDSANQAGCNFNLSQIGTGLFQYRDRYDSYPYLPPDSPASHAGSFALMLHDAGYLADSNRLHCPCNNHTGNTQHPPLPDFQAACLIKQNNPEHFERLIGGDYAYQVGLRRPGSPLMNASLQLAPTTPLLADQPPHSGISTILEGNSPNHRSMGQNVLYGDGHSQWHRSRRLSPRDADMFLNHNERPGPSTDLEDSVMVPATFLFHGR